MAFIKPWMPVKHGSEWALKKHTTFIAYIIDPTNPNVVYVAAIGNPYAEHPERGVYKTTDGGETWNHILIHQ